MSAFPLYLLTAILLLSLTLVIEPRSLTPSEVISKKKERLEINFDEQDGEEGAVPLWDVDYEGNEAYFRKSSQSPPESDSVTPPEDVDWIPDAVRDVAYYIRQYKFNEFDRRYNSTNYNVTRGFYSAFPTPPLLNMHWEVREVCEEGFLECLRYLKDKVNSVRLRRSDDTYSSMLEEKLRWHGKLMLSDDTEDTTDRSLTAILKAFSRNWRINNDLQIADLDKVCVHLRDQDEADFQGFLGPIDRFQWRTTAAYYMCHFAMQETKFLQHLGEQCDNFAWCLDPEFGPTNGDPRADDSVPFACAVYSFCPDPCCALRSARKTDECRKSEGNPCRYANYPPGEAINPAAAIPCSLKLSWNVNLQAGMANQWNTSCECRNKGYHWESRFGFCVDTDECLEGACSNKTDEICWNLVGGWECRCQWGLTRNSVGQCVPNRQLYKILGATEGGARVSEVDDRKMDFWNIIQDIIVPS